MNQQEARDDEREALIADARQEAGKWGPGPTATGSLLRRLADALEYRKHPEPETTDERQWEYRTTVDGYDPQPHARLTRGDATEAEVLAMLADDPRPLILERRRPAGPWMSVGEGEQ